MIIIIDFF